MDVNNTSNLSAPPSGASQPNTQSTIALVHSAANSNEQLHTNGGSSNGDSSNGGSSNGESSENERKPNHKLPNLGRSRSFSSISSLGSGGTKRSSFSSISSLGSGGTKRSSLYGSRDPLLRRTSSSNNSGSLSRPRKNSDSNSSKSLSRSQKSSDASASSSRKSSNASEQHPLLGSKKSLSHASQKGSASSLPKKTPPTFFNGPPDKPGEDKSEAYKRKGKLNNQATEKSKPKEPETPEERPKKHKHKSKNGSSKITKKEKNSASNYCCIPMVDESSDEEEEQSSCKAVMGLFFLGMLAGVGGALTFLRYGGAAATAVGGFASISHSANSDSKVKGDDNTVVGSGSSGVINVNRVLGNGHLGIGAADSLAYPGMDEALKSECLKKGMTYIDPTTGEWIGFSSTARAGKCLLDLPEELIKGKCIREKADADILALREKLKAEYEKTRLQNAHELLNEKDRRDFLLAKAQSKNEDILVNQYIASADLSVRHNRQVRSLDEEENDTPSTSDDPQASDADTRDLLNEMRGEKANEDDKTEGLNWLRKARKPK
jgi:hypothetical protein